MEETNRVWLCPLVCIVVVPISVCVSGKYSSVSHISIRSPDGMYVVLAVDIARVCRRPSKKVTELYNCEATAPSNWLVTVCPTSAIALQVRREGHPVRPDAVRGATRRLLEPAVRPDARRAEGGAAVRGGALLQPAHQRDRGGGVPRYGESSYGEAFNAILTPFLPFQRRF